ncbi:hypothetical protein HNY73_022088 [Argiope bruennichi]|uniref:Uncharacterized protein n=1 Tax=Argiope bruennichi TaxID=94029 RepID=A0A8T0DZS3_ARGBR|nr:hypothetical protein HNY73_022088 [Argiope bruennichi]
MEYRRIYGLRAPRPVGDSTFLVPQMENYSLFSNPFLDLNKRIGKLMEGIQQDAKPEKGVKAKGKKQEEQKSKESKAGDDKKTLPKETSAVEVNFGIVLNVVTVKPEELVIKFGAGNELEVTVAQRNVHLKERITFSRRCSYKYELPDGIDKNSLVALRTSDDYLIILQRALLREDLLKKSIEDAEQSEEPCDKDVEEATKSTDKKETDTKPGKKQKAQKKGLEKAAEDTKETEKILPDPNCMIPVQVARMLRPGMDIFMLRKYMADLESYIATVRKFIENASFVTQNSKTAERCLRAIAKEKTDKYYEERNITGQKIKRKFTKEPSPESGYTSPGNQTQPSGVYDESSGSSSTKSGQTQETSN